MTSTDTTKVLQCLLAFFLGERLQTRPLWLNPIVYQALTRSISSVNGPARNRTPGGVGGRRGRPRLLRNLLGCISGKGHRPFLEQKQTTLDNIVHNSVRRCDGINHCWKWIYQAVSSDVRTRPTHMNEKKKDALKKEFEDVWRTI